MDRYDFDFKSDIKWKVKPDGLWVRWEDVQAEGDRAYEDGFSKGQQDSLKHIGCLHNRITDFKTSIRDLQEEDGCETELTDKLENMLEDDRVSEKENKK